MEQLKLFLEKAKTDGGLMAKLDELGAKKAADDEIIALAAEHGFTFTKEELEQLRTEGFTLKSRQLCEEELENISGGQTKYDRFNHEICSQYTEVHYYCVGFLGAHPCKYYQISRIGQLGDNRYHHKCEKYYFDYVGSLTGKR